MPEINKPILSISMLVSNGRKDTIKKCMESLTSLRAAVPSELILVDTGCTDGSIDIAREYADRVVNFTWCNDFAAARNAGLRECSGEWFLYLDDDEWFEDTREIEQFFVSGEYKKYEAAEYIQRNYSNLEGTSYTDGYAGRMHVLGKDTVFCGKIHEWLEPLVMKVKYFNSFVHHYGYVFKDEETRKKHFERNLTLEEAAVEGNPKDIRMWCQLVQEYRWAERYEDAERACKKALEVCRDVPKKSFWQYLLVSIPKIYSEQGRKAEALEELFKIEKMKELQQQARIVCLFEKLLLLTQLARKEEVVPGAVAYLKAVEERNRNIGELPVMDMLEYMSGQSRSKAAELGILGMFRTGDFAEADYLFSQLDWNRKTDWQKDILLLFLQRYGTMENDSLFLRESKRILENEELREVYQTTLEQIQKKNQKMRPILSISMLVSNGRTDTIRKCMESLVPLRAAVPSELIIVDTGCTDGSIEIARGYADQVVKFTWCDDFAAARNAGLELCIGEWFMFIDDDEWFEDVSDIVEFFQSGEYKKYGRAAYIARNYTNIEGTEYTDTTAERLYRLVPGLRFQGKLHEILPLFEGDTCRLKSFVHHYGYVYRTVEERKKHAERNFSILNRMIVEQPEDFRTMAHLVQEYMASKMFSEAEELCKKAIHLGKEQKIKDYSEYFILTMPQIYREKGSMEEAVRENARIVKEENLSKYAWTKFFAEKCVLETLCGNAQAVFEAMLRYLVLLEDKGEKGVPLLDLLQYSTPFWKRKVLRMGVEAMFLSKDFRYAEAIFSRVEWEEKNPVPYEWVSLLQRYFAESGDMELFCKYSEKILLIPDLNEAFIPAIHLMMEHYPEQEEMFAKAVKRLRQPKVNPELQALGEQMKEIIETQIAAGNLEEAKALLLEVETMLPGEGWICELKEKLL